MKISFIGFYKCHLRKKQKMLNISFMGNILLQQLESSKMAVLTAKMSKIEEASRKKDEQTSQFIATTREALEQKMGQHEEKREAYITDLKTKLKVNYYGTFIRKFTTLRKLIYTNKLDF